MKMGKGLQVGVGWRGSRGRQAVSKRRRMAIMISAAPPARPLTCGCRCRQSRSSLSVCRTWRHLRALQARSGSPWTTGTRRRGRSRPAAAARSAPQTCLATARWGMPSVWERTTAGGGSRGERQLRACAAPTPPPPCTASATHCCPPARPHAHVDVHRDAVLQGVGPHAVGEACRQRGALLLDERGIVLEAGRVQDLAGWRGLMGRRGGWVGWCSGPTHPPHPCAYLPRAQSGCSAGRAGESPRCDPRGCGSRPPAWRAPPPPRPPPAPGCSRSSPCG